ncbi:DUF2247 family protein, partial [Sphaerisporangium rufum]|uniref:DUF2247 family protein n=1 Tax=Sphaerisporangium rufum TaxID=1381558 RepID=UPI001951F8BA
MSDLVRFPIPADFISSRVALTAGELVCGYRAGWLSSADLAEFARGVPSELLPGLPTEEEMSYLLPSEAEDKVRAAVQARDDLDCAEPETERVWRYLALAWLYERRNTISGFWDVIEMMWSDAGYPEEMEPFIYHLPPLPGEESGETAMLRRLASYLSERADRYRTRGNSS